MDKKDKLKILKETVNKINKTHGEGTVMSLSDSPIPTEVISTGSFGLDLALGVGGLPKGRIVEIYGPESSGKTTIAIHVIAEAQKGGGLVAFIDAEHAFDREYAKNLGVNADELILHQPNSGEEALQIADELISSGALDVVVIDSVAALTPKAELEGEMGDQKMGLQARLMGQALRKLVAATSKNNVLLIFINQTREKIGIMYGSPITTTGGNALKFYASVRLDVTKSVAKSGDEIYGNKTRVKVVKSKVAPPFKVAEFDIIFGQGIDKQGEVLDIAIGHDIVKQGGSWLTYKDTKIQGKDNFKQLMRDNPELFNEIEKLVKNKIND